jgi:hypothetical protein
LPRGSHFTRRPQGRETEKPADAVHTTLHMVVMELAKSVEPAGLVSAVAGISRAAGRICRKKLPTRVDGAGGRPLESSTLQ